MYSILNNAFSQLYLFQSDKDIERINNASVLLRLAYIEAIEEIEEYNLLKLCHTGK